MRRGFKLRSVPGKTFFNFRAGDGEVIRSCHALRFVGQFHRRHDLSGHGHAEVGGNQSLLDFFQRFGGQLGRARDDALDFVRELGVRFLQAGFEFGE